MGSWIDQQQRAFAQALDAVAADAPVIVLCPNDADGLSAGALLARGLARISRPTSVRLIGRGESPWSDPVKGEVRSANPGLVVVSDLGVRAEPIIPGTATVLIDHHVPHGMPEGATVISGYGQEPVPSSSLLAYWCLQAVAEGDDLLWLAALGLIGDYARKARSLNCRTLGAGMAPRPCGRRPPSLTRRADRAQAMPSRPLTCS
jgi:single-stranded-DNA-specific exonuclease